jgi:hypothetical protein
VGPEIFDGPAEGIGMGVPSAVGSAVESTDGLPNAAPASTTPVAWGVGIVPIEPMSTAFEPPLLGATAITT